MITFSKTFVHIKFIYAARIRNADEFEYIIIISSDRFIYDLHEENVLYLIFGFFDWVSLSCARKAILVSRFNFV